MEDPSLSALFIDFEQTSPGLSRAAVVGNVRYRQRTPDRGCLHGRVTIGTPIDGMAHVECDGCKLGWLSVIEPRRTIADAAASEVR